MRMTVATSMLIIVALGLSQASDAQSLGGFKLPKPSEFREKTSGLKKLFGAGTGCVVGGTVGHTVFKTIDDKFLEEGHSEKDVEKMGMIAAGVGCVLGGKVALAVIEGMDEKSRAKQEEAWAQAISNGDNRPVQWQGPRESGYSGSVSYEASEPMADGADCVTRKDYVSDGAGQDATAYNRYCKNDNNKWERIETA